jgi:hypothetical protein
VHFSVIPQPEKGITHNQLVMVKRKNNGWSAQAQITNALRPNSYLI